MTRPNNPTKRRSPGATALADLLDQTRWQMIQDMSDEELEAELREDGVDPAALTKTLRGLAAQAPLYLSACRIAAQSTDDPAASPLRPWVELASPLHPALRLRLHLFPEHGTAELVLEGTDKAPPVYLDSSQMPLELRRFDDCYLGPLKPEAVQRLAELLGLSDPYRTWADSEHAPLMALQKKLAALARGASVSLTRFESLLLSMLWQQVQAAAAPWQALAERLSSLQPAYRVAAPIKTVLPEPLVLVREQSSAELALTVLWQTLPQPAPAVQVLRAGKPQPHTLHWNTTGTQLEVSGLALSSENYRLAWDWQADENRLVIMIEPAG